MHTTREISPTVFADARSRGLSAVAARILAGRLSEATRLDAVIAPQLANIPPPSKLQDADRAIARLARAVTDHESIGVLTDYDADGLTSHAVLTHALVRFGVAEDRISHWIGHRLEDGYGISGTLVDRLLESGDQPTVVISADCGSSDEPHIARLKAAGIDVIVTDHHRVSDAGPPVSAYAVVNPNRDDCEYPDQAIAGCMVSWLVMSGLRQALIAQGVLGESCPKLGDLLDYVALGTVADCVSLGDSEINRAVVNAGLQYIKARRRPCWDVAATHLTRADRDISSEWLAFQLAPRLNARGRIDHSMLGFEFLWTDSRADAESAFLQLDADNKTRRALETKMVETAKPLARRSRVAGSHVICVVLHDGHAGVQGIVASRLVEAEGVPALVLTPGSEPGTLTGSMRSIQGVDAKLLLDDVVSEVPQAILRYGGHTGACGLTLVEAELPSFSETLQRVFSSRYPSHPVAPRFITDGTLLVEDFSLERVHELEPLGPFGRGFEAPVFDGVFEVLSSRQVGSDGTHLSLEFSIDGQTVRGIWFSAQPTGHPAAASPGDWLQCVFGLSINTYRGLELSITVRHGEVVTEGVIDG